MECFPNDIIHLKIRNIFPEIHRDSNTTLDFQTRTATEIENNFASYWDRYIAKAEEMEQLKLATETYQNHFQF